MAKRTKVEKGTETRKVSKEEAVAALRDLVSELDACSAVSEADPAFKQWLESAHGTLRHVFGSESDELLAFIRISFSSPYLASPRGFIVDEFGPRDYPSQSRDGSAFFRSGVQEARGLLNVHIKQVERFWRDESVKASPGQELVDVVVKICERFHVAARRLRKRRDSRPPLLMGDEYDVQYLLGAILDIHFDDIAPEDWVPSYAGGGSRIDFVLRRERVAVEVKRTRSTLTAGKVGEELIVDIARYEQHNGVDTLICFVYDPENFIENPRGLEHDLEKMPSGRLNVRAVVRPL